MEKLVVLVKLESQEPMDQPGKMVKVERRVILVCQVLLDHRDFRERKERQV